MTNDEVRAIPERLKLLFGHSIIRASFVIRHSRIVIF
jgi:hypothetical protein